MANPDVLRGNLRAAIRYVEQNKGRYVEQNKGRYVEQNKGRFVSNPGKDFSRNRRISMGEIITALISMNGGTLQRELHKYAAAGGAEISPSAFCQSRAKIKPKAFETVFHKFNQLCDDGKDLRKYHLYAVDGSCINMARNPDSPCFVHYDSNPQGYCQIHLNAWYDLDQKIYLEALLQPQPRTDERRALMNMVERNHFQGRNILTMDRGYESYAVFAAILAKPNLDFVCRIKDRKGCMKPLKDWPMEELDKEVSVTITTSQSKEDKEKGYIFVQTRKHQSKKYSPKTRDGHWPFPSPYTLKFRIVRFLLPTGQYETIATSLPRSFTVDEIRTIYARRWGIESSFKQLKYAANLINLHGRSDDFVVQEVYAALVAYNFASRAANMAVIKKSSNCVYSYQVNFTMAVYLCREYLRHRRGDGEILLQKIQKYTEPIRPGRMDKRKIRPKGFVAFTYRVAA